MIKLTARVDEEIYNEVMYPLRYGQQTALIQALMEGLAKLIRSEGISPIVLFIAGQGPITLHAGEEEADAPNGSNKTT